MTISGLEVLRGGRTSKFGSWNKRHNSSFNDIVSITNLLGAWREFKRGKNKKPDVALFGLQLEQHIFELHEERTLGTYRHSAYTDFIVCDPKRRHIHKACVRDRVVQQAVYRVLYGVFDKHFICDSFSSRLSKGTHKGVERLEKACSKVTKNNKMTAYALKCDIRKFFDSIDHARLTEILYKKVEDTKTRELLQIILNSFEKESGKGLPLGNVTSQLFANIYMNELDQYAKHTLKCKYYFRYADDFVILHLNKEYLQKVLADIRLFLKENLLLELHPQKVSLKKVSQGVDFLGYIVLPYHKRLRTKTKKRIEKKLLKNNLSKESLTSYSGVVGHARERVLQNKIQTKIKILRK